jgi:hypothetical protein
MRRSSGTPAAGRPDFELQRDHRFERRASARIYSLSFRPVLVIFILLLLLLAITLILEWPR